MTDCRMISANGPRRLGGLLLASLFLTCSGCTRSAVPLTLVPETSTPGELATPIPPTPTLGSLVINPSGATYAVVWVLPGEALPLRQPAGVAGAPIGSLPADARGVRLSGNSLYLGSSQWVEVASPGATGWVKSRNLTEAVSPADFCADSRVPDLLQSFAQAIDNRNGLALVSLISARRGLVIRHDWWNPEVILPASFIPEVFVSPAEWEWGMERVGEMPIQGTFPAVMLPLVDDVLGGDPEVTCNSLRAGTTAETVRWPGEYTNLNFYAYYRPDRQLGTGFSWRTCAIGIEYVDGRPYVAVLVFFRGEI